MHSGYYIAKVDDPMKPEIKDYRFIPDNLSKKGRVLYNMIPKQDIRRIIVHMQHWKQVVNTANIDNILTNREKIAYILGYQNFSEYFEEVICEYDGDGCEEGE